MIQLILKRLFTYIPVLLVVVIITFLMIHAAPGGPFDAERVARGGGQSRERRESRPGQGCPSPDGRRNGLARFPSNG